MACSVVVRWTGVASRSVGISSSTRGPVDQCAAGQGGAAEFCPHIYPVAVWSVFQDHLRGLVPAEDSRIAVAITADAVVLSDRQGTAGEAHVYTHRNGFASLTVC